MAISEKQLEQVVSAERKTAERLKIAQCEHSMSVYNNLELIRKNKYLYNGEEYSISDPNTHIYLVKDLNLYGKSNNDPMFIKTLKDAILNNLVVPLLFIKEISNDEYRIVSWNDVIIVRNYNYTYFIVSNIPHVVESIGCIRISSSIKYSSTLVKNIENGIMVTEDGYTTDDYTKAEYGIELLSPSLDKKVYNNFTQEDKGFYIELDYPTEIFMDNIIINYDNKLSYDVFKYLIPLGNNTFKFKDGVDPEKLECIVYFYNKANESLTNVYNLPSETLKKYAIMDLEGTAPDFYQVLKETLNMSGSMEDKYNQILEYSSKLLQNTDTSEAMYNNSTSLCMTGTELSEKLNDTFHLVMPRKRWAKYGHEEICGLCHVMIFKNYKLYEYQSAIKYVGSNFVCPFKDQVNPDDIFEIVFIAGDRCNKIAELTIRSKDEQKTTSPMFDLDNCFLFDPNPTPKEYEIPLEDICPTMQYQCIADIKNVPNKQYTYTVEYESDKYYNTTVAVISKHQYGYFRYTNNSDMEEIHISLPDSFKYYQNPNQYMVFVNGERIDKEYIDLAIPNENNPYYELGLFISVIIKKDDNIDIFYLPFEYLEAVKNNTIPTNGTITVDGSALPFGLNKDNYFYFVNGRKVPYSCITEISSNTVKIATDIKNTNNLSIVFTGLTDYQTEEIVSSDALSDLIGNLSEEGMNSLYKNANITNDGENVYEDSVIRKALLMYIYKFYYSLFFTGQPMLYDANDELLEELDVDENDVYLTDLYNAPDEGNVINIPLNEE